MNEVPGGMPRNYLRPCLLLLIAETPAHGYDLLEQIGQFGLDTADAGGVYRCLRAMEQEGLVRSWWEESQSGPRRRTYALTDEGLEWLHAWAGSLREVRRLIGRYLDRYDRMLRRPVGTP